ncbi:MAG: zf-HC2 domain-containing protein [Acidobacteriaceae bacterium]|nr:zf-HC2 domain-containing protein [Acidobacteriaceae bacterium]
MKHVREEQLALYAGGDLASEEANTVATHLAGCPACRGALAEFRDAQAFFCSSAREPEAGELYDVRQRLVAKLERRTQGERRWVWQLAGAAVMAAVIVLAVAFEHRPAVSSKAEPMVARAVAPELPVAPPPVQQPVGMRRVTAHTRRSGHREAGIRSVSLIARADQPPVIRMTTADPNVVILWQSREGQQQ